MGMKTFRLLLIVAAVAWFGWENLARELAPNAQYDSPASKPGSALQQAISARQSDVQVRSRGRVVRVLPDDNQGSRHQRFILDVGAGQTILIAHNIDLAPRIDNLRQGDEVAFNGEYEWNDRGGVVHWTHRDPQRRHEGGWLKHAGRTYQ